MPFALELALDDVAAAAVRKLWGELAAAGFTFPAMSGANPHLSLAIWDTIDREATERALVAFATATAPVDVILVRGDAFASSGTVFLAPEVDGRLLEERTGRRAPGVALFWRSAP